MPTPLSQVGTHQTGGKMNANRKPDNTRHIGRRNRSIIRDRIAKRDYALALKGA